MYPERGFQQRVLVLYEKSVVTRHRLVRCPAQVLLDQAMLRYPTLPRDGRPIDQVEGAGIWFSCRSQRARPAVFWRQRLPGNLHLRCCLEVEEGANGVLAHLSAQPIPDPTSPLAVLVSRLAVEPWIAHELSILARDAEVMSRLNLASGAGSWQSEDQRGAAS